MSSEGVGGELQPLDPDVKLCVENGAASRPGTAVAICSAPIYMYNYVE